ncbi:MAG: sugar ABC transporter permease [Bacteroidetes bacterium]|nr:sugar ABC transporter permease [Bacteroidota bacterium]
MRHTLILPWLIIFCAFWLVPIVASFLMSLTDYSYLSGVPAATFRGFGNYSSILQNPSFWNAAWNTLVFTSGTVPITIMLALILAALLNEAERFQSFFRTAFFLPSVLSVTVLCMIFDQFYAREGYLGKLAAILGLETPGLLLMPGTALFSVMAMDVFVSVGYYTILFLAAMKSVPSELAENTRLMGASFFQQFWLITLPLVKPMILFAVVINTIKSLQIFTEIYMLTKGGPLQSTTTVVYWLYELGFKRFESGYASALAYLLLAATAFISWLQMRILVSNTTSKS